MDLEAMLALARRVDTLERQNRRLRQIGIVVLSAAAALVLMGQARGPGVVQAAKLELVDATGAVRATLAIAYPQDAAHSDPFPDFSRGAASLTFYNRDGSRNSDLGANTTDDSAHLTLWGGSGGVLHLSAHSDGANINLSGNPDAGTLPGAVMYAGHDGSGHLLLGDKAGTILWQAP